MPALPTRWPSASLALGLLVAGCNPEPGVTKPAASSKTETTTPATQAPPTQAKPSGDPKMLAICRAYDEVVAEGTASDVILQTAALRAVEKHGVTEAELSAYGATPTALLKSIQDRGDPPACAPLVEALKAKL